GRRKDQSSGAASLARPVWDIPALCRSRRHGRMPAGARRIAMDRSTANVTLQKWLAALEGMEAEARAALPPEPVAVPAPPFGQQLEALIRPLDQRLAALAGRLDENQQQAEAIGAELENDAAAAVAQLRRIGEARQKLAQALAARYDPA